MVNNKIVNDLVMEKKMYRMPQTEAQLIEVSRSIMITSGSLNDLGDVGI